MHSYQIFSLPFVIGALHQFVPRAASILFFYKGKPQNPQPRYARRKPYGAGLTKEI
jgi:hypothetical protein